MNFKPVKLAFNVFKPSNGTESTLPPIIFLHGLTSSKEYWNDIPQRISEVTKRIAYAYDARNHGESGYSDEYNFNLNIEDLFHFMDDNKITRTILVGHSMGGVTATRAAMKKPEKVEKVFVEDMYVKRFPKSYVDAGLPILFMRKDSVKHMPKELSKEEAIQFSNNFIIEKIPNDSPLQSRVEEIRKSSVNLKRNFDGSFDVNYNFYAIVKALKDYETLVSEPSGQYDGPAYFIYGSLSIFNVENEEESILTYFPKAELIKIRGAGHNVHIEFPEEFVASLMKYL